MSLNGLDIDAVVQAHQNAVTEAGGWFLLKYASRDTVELLANGVGGVDEARSAVANYEEKSPLYGLVHYRRKKFILKYVPEGTSRLLQVRLAVQFQSILDAFTPYDTVFAFSSTEELSESALGLNNILKSGSKTSSSSSLRQQRLKEIVEDNEEAFNAETMSDRLSLATQQPVTSSLKEDDGLPASAARAKAMLAQRRSESRQSTAPVPSTEQEATTAPVIEQQPRVPLNEPPERIVSMNSFPPRTSSISTDKALPVIPVDTGSPVSLSRVISAYQRPSLDFSIPVVESDSDDDFRRPMPKEYHQVPVSNHLTATESSNISRWTDEVVASTQTKQKRAPKPHGDSQVRPKTSGAQEDNIASRRVANLPPSVRVSNRAPSQQSSRPGSQQSARSMPGRFVPSPNLPPPLPSPVMPESPERHAYKKSRSQASSFVESQAIPPEKLRLMKALQMRKRNQLLAQRSASAGSTTAATLNSIDSSSSHSSVSPAAQSSSLKRSEPPVLENADVSITTSPVSILTASDTQSTKPSSLSEESPVNHSQTSLSSDTNSSTTPKADKEETPDQILQVSERSKVQENISKEKDIQTSKLSVSEPVPESVSQTTTECLPVETVEHDLRSVRGSKKRYQFDQHINIPASNTEASDISDDESFMEELQNATVQEAKPMSVNRTPMTPVLAKVPMRDVTPISPDGVKSRTTSHGSQVSTPDKRPIASRAGSTRSLSTALPQWPPVPTEPVPALPKQRPGISAGIVTRVNTFESLGQKEAALLQRDPSSRLSSFSNMLKRASVISHPYNNDRLEQTSNVSLPSRPGVESDEEQERLNSRPIVQRPGTSAEVYTPIHKGESVSITARIVRDSDKPHTAHGSGDAKDMHWSPLIVEHQNSVNHTRPSLPRELTTQSADSLPSSIHERRRFSFSSHKPITKPLSPTDTRSNRLSSAGSNKKPSRAASESSSITDEKKGSRASRMLKRLSALGTSRSRNKESPVTSPTYEIPHPETINEQGETQDPSAMRTVVDIGEVNVQFPETLLWKRRFLRVDDQGFLIFAAPVNDSSTRGKSRKFHLDELYKPALPDREREQMAWSIVLDLKTGGTVQCACESGSAQRSFLKMLVDAHAAYNQLYIT